MKPSIPSFIPILGLLLSALAFAGGPLSPPGGAPGVTMKSLDEVEPRTPISTAPFTITKAGSYYLTADLLSAGDGITVSVDEVDIDLNGYTLRGSGFAGIRIQGSSVNNPRKQIRIHNGNILEFSNGVYLSDAGNCRIEKVHFEDHNSAGILSGRSNGIVAEDCVITDSATGINLNVSSGLSQGNIIRRCMVLRTTSYGMILSADAGGDFSGALVEHCLVDSTGSYGIYQRSTGGGLIRGNRIQDNTVSRATVAGFNFSGGTDTRVERNHASLTTEAGSSYGFYFSGTQDFYIVGNSASGNVQDFSFGNADIQFDNNANSARDAVEAAVETLRDPRTPITTLPITITTPGSYYLTGNFTTASTAISINSSDVTIDLNGFSLTGGGTGSAIWISGTGPSPVQNVVVRNGILAGFGYGVQLTAAENCRVSDLEISSCNTGVYLQGASTSCLGNLCENIKVRGGSIGIYLYCNASTASVSNNTIRQCSVMQTSSYGIYLTNRFASGGKCDGNRIEDCRVGNAGSYGIWLRGDPVHPISGCLVQGSDVTDCVDKGLFLQAVIDTRVDQNHVTGTTSTTTSIGIQSSVTANNLIIRNSAFGQDLDFDFDVDDTYGPVITGSGPLNNTNPWANFGRNVGL